MCAYASRTHAIASVLAALLCVLLDQRPLTSTSNGSWCYIAPREAPPRKVAVVRRSAEEDWREFRARLVQQERDSVEPVLPVDVEQVSGWAHPSPLIEQGSVLLSSPGDHFALNQQYFHKAVILIFQHDDNGDMGLILNRPTMFTTDDLELPLKVMSPATDPESSSAFRGLRASSPRQQWPVWCGGDCEGLNTPSNQLCFCLHILDTLADISREVIKGVYLIDYEEAQSIVEAGNADKEDFMLFVGYCGWGAGQMQSELDRGDAWIMAAVGQQALLGELRKAESLLVNAASSGAVEDGIEDWRKLYVSLGLDFHKHLAQARMTGDDEHTDKMLHRWIQRCLVPAKPELTVAAAARVAKFRSLQPGAILRGSATAWLLGKPSEGQHFSSRRFRPAQYLHKGVLLLLNGGNDAEPSALVLLNGPVVGKMPDGTDVSFGGMSSLGSLQDTVSKVGSDNAVAYVMGSVVLLPGALQKLVALGALEVADGIKVEDVLAVKPAQRWQAAGGSEPEPNSPQADVVISGDLQQRKWYARFLGLQKT